MKTITSQGKSVHLSLYRTFFENSTLPVAVLDKDLKIVKANSLFCDFIGLPPHHNLTELPIDQLPFNADPHFKELLDHVLRHRLDKLEFETNILSSFYEEQRQLKVIFTTDWKDQTFQGGLLLLQDVTQFQKKIELLEERIKTIKQENEVLKHTIEDAEGLEQFSLLAAHDLKGPIRVIGNFSQLLIKRYQEVLDEEGRDYLQFVHDSATHLNMVLTDMIHYADIARKPLSFDIFDFHQLIRQIKARLTPLLERHQAILTFENPPKLLNGSRKYIRLLFHHLIENAIKFAKPDHPPHIRITYERTPEAHLFGVHDNGIGIAPTYHKHVFSLFKRLDPTTNRPGSGVGLAICKKIVERHGGRIWVESEEGKGASFYFTLKRI